MRVERDGQPLVLRPAHLVMATGVSGQPNVPSFPGMEVFEGDQHHSSVHPGPDGYRGKTCVVVGSNNSAFDICGALWEAGAASVTMVQRSSSHIVKSDALMEIGVGALYSEEAVAAGMTTEKADLIFASLPYRIMHEFQIPLYEQMRERDKDFYERLEAAGFEHDWGDDGSPGLRAPGGAPPQLSARKVSLAETGRVRPACHYRAAWAITTPRARARR